MFFLVFSFSSTYLRKSDIINKTEKPMLRYQDFEMLIALNDSQSITTAAEKLYISQPALTKWLHRIEADLGIVIVKRSARGIAFTMEGQHLVRYGAIALDNYKKELYTLHGIKEEKERVVTMMSAGSMAGHFLPKLLSSYKKENPDVVYSLQYAGSNLTAKGIYEGKADVGFIRGEPWTNCNKELIRTEYAAIISKNEIKDMSILPSLPRIDADVSESARLFINNWWQDQYDISPNVSMNVQTIYDCLNLVREGLGYSIVISADVYENLDDINVYPLKRANGSPVTRADYMIWQPNSNMNKTTQDFIRFARNYFKQFQTK